VHDVIVVAGVPGIARDRIAAGRVVAALISRAAAAAPESLRRVPGQICVGPAKLNRYNVGLSVPQAGRRLEIEPVIRLSIYVSQVLAVLGCGYGSYQRSVCIDINVDYVAGIVGVPCPAADCVAAGPVMRPLQVSGAAASDALGTAAQRDARAGNL